MRKKKTVSPLIHRSTAKIRFSEVDVMQIAWHGSYVKYIEDGREDFGKRFTGIGYMDIYRSGFKAPIVDLQIQYKNPVGIGNMITIETRYIPCDAAKIIFEYTIYDENGKEIITASTIQVFLDENGNLVLQNPSFYEEWKKKWITG